MIDARAMRFETLNYAWDPGNPLSGEKPTIRDLSGTCRRRVIARAGDPERLNRADSVPLHACAGRDDALRDHLLHVATVVAPFTTDHLFFSTLTSV